MRLARLRLGFPLAAHSAHKVGLPILEIQSPFSWYCGAVNVINDRTLGESMDLVKELKLEMEKAANRVKSLAAAIAALGGGNSSNHKTGRRKMSAAARRKISLAQKARWKSFHAKKAKLR